MGVRADLTGRALRVESFDTERRPKRPLANRTLWSLFVAMIVLVLVVSEALYRTILVLQYADELTFVLLGVVLFVRIVRNVACREVKLLTCVLIALSCIGFCGNVLFGVQVSTFAVVIDWCSCMKAPVCFLAIYDSISGDDSYQISYTLNSIAKILIVASAVFGTISLFKNIGMSGEVRFGVAAFSFVFGQQHALAIILISFLLIISVTESCSRSFWFYFLLVVYSLLLTTKGPSLIWVAIAPFFILRSSNRFKFKLRHLLPLLVVAVILGGYQISNYLMNDTSPRYLLMANSVITAKHYLPTGAGFASYGSDMAAKFYSPLYYEYGFASRWGMSPASTMFLNDHYWPMVLGQFGYCGLILFLFLFVRVFRLIQSGARSCYVRELAVANCIYIAIHSLGSASITSSMGVLLFIVLAIAARTLMRDGGSN